MSANSLPEPWLRGNLSDVHPISRAVIHALQLATEDLQRWCSGLSDLELNARPGGIAPVAFHLRHIARSIDRLLTYAEGGALSAEQMTALKEELVENATGDELFTELRQALTRAETRVRAFNAATFGDVRKVGKKGLPTTVGGLLVHVADHTQRHVGQAITTAKIVAARRGEPAEKLSSPSQ